jgi:carbonic anhydrase/acetyltransferase-like protein (isoleucine patch superfamily)
MQRRLLRTIQRNIKNGPINEHRTIFNLYNFKPIVWPEAMVHPSCTIIGEVTVSGDSQVWPNTVIRGDMNAVLVEKAAIIMENCSISSLPSILNSGEIASTYIGQRAIVAPNCTLVSCTVSEECYIGAGSVICEGAKIDVGSFIGPGSVVPPNRYIPPGQLWAGSPVRYVKSIDKSDRVALMDIRQEYQNKVDTFEGEYSTFNSAYLESEELLAKTNSQSEYIAGTMEEKYSPQE